MFTVIFILMLLYFIVTFMAGIIIIFKFFIRDEEITELERPVKKKKLEE